jgi:hypothetical protein
MINQRRRNNMNIYAHSLSLFPSATDETIPMKSVPEVGAVSQAAIEIPAETIPDDHEMEELIWREMEQQVQEKEKERLSRDLIEKIEENKRKALEIQRRKEQQRMEEERKREEERISAMVQEADLFLD